MSGAQPHVSECLAGKRRTRVRVSPVTPTSTQAAGHRRRRPGGDTRTHRQRAAYGLPCWFRTLL